MDSLREEIDAACLADPCSPRIIDTLESYLSELVKAKAYDFERLKLLAKLYAFFPELSNTKVRSAPAPLPLPLPSPSPPPPLLSSTPTKEQRATGSYPHARADFTMRIDIRGA